MDQAAAWGFLAAWPLIAVAIYIFTRRLIPIWGYLAGLCVYWFAVLTPLILWRGGPAMADISFVLPSTSLIVLNLIAIAMTAGAAFMALRNARVPFALLVCAVLAAILNGTLEETFWRGILLRDDASTFAIYLQLFMFTAWHIALLFAAGIRLTGGPAGLLLGAAFLGYLWTLARVETGAIGFNIVCHIALNIFAFTELAVRNAPDKYNQH